MSLTYEKLNPSIATGQHLHLLGHKGYGVTELRFFKPQAMVAYVDNENAAIRLVHEMDDKVSGIYVGVQPRDVDLFDYAPNRWKPAVGSPESNCASDKDIQHITAIFFDIDISSLQRREGYPASDKELPKSLKAAQLLSRQDGLALCSTICCSGNGHYVLAPIVPIPVDSDEIAAKFKQFCQQLADKISAQVSNVKLDPVYNLSRVMRLMGTVNRKGRAIPDRPHRRAHFITEPLPVVSQALHYMILNTEIAVPQGKNNIQSGTIKCDLKKIEVCDFIKWCRKQPTEVSEPQWFAMINNLARLEGGPDLIHEISALDTLRYDYQQTQSLIQRVLSREYRPSSCENLKTTGFLCPNLGHCPAKAPMYLTTLYSKYTR